MELFPGYCVDTSALVDLRRRLYPPDVFPSLAARVQTIITEGNLVAPREVLKELEKVDDEVLRWAKQHEKMFSNLDSQQRDLAHEILAQFPRRVDSDKTIPDADPFVIALARAKRWTVITSEKPATPGGRPMIPDVCQHYEVECLGLLDFFRKRGWSF